MNKFIVRDCEQSDQLAESGILISLKLLIRRMSLGPLWAWSFRDISLVYQSPFGLAVQEFERLSRDLELGFLVSDEDFRKFLMADFQILNGFIDAYDAEAINAFPLFTIECIDTAQWEISTLSPAVTEKLQLNGFRLELVK